MVTWCAGYLGQHDSYGGASFQRCIGNTVEELNDLLDPLTSPKHDFDEPSLWPLVEKVTVGVPAVRVLKYVDLMDLPGITDTNTVRVQTTRESIGKCHGLWYVLDITRAITDPGLERTVSVYADRFSGTLAVVVTKSDQYFNDRLAADMRNKGQSIVDFPYTERREI